MVDLGLVPNLKINPEQDQKAKKKLLRDRGPVPTAEKARSPKLSISSGIEVIVPSPPRTKEKR